MSRIVEVESLDSKEVTAMSFSPPLKPGEVESLLRGVAQLYSLTDLGLQLTTGKQRIVYTVTANDPPSKLFQ